MNISIRKAAIADFDDIFVLMMEFAEFQDKGNKVFTNAEQLKKDDNLFQCLIAEDDHHNKIGFALFFFAYYSWTGKALYIDDLYVRKSFRQNGIGKMLINEVISYAKETNCTKVRWQVSHWNLNAQKFYKKIGAEIDQTEINCNLNFKHIHNPLT